MTKEKGNAWLGFAFLRLKRIAKVNSDLEKMSIFVRMAHWLFSATSRTASCVFNIKIQCTLLIMGEITKHLRFLSAYGQFFL